MSRKARLAMITGMVASPSSPSVRFTALPNATITNAPKSDVEPAEVDHRLLDEGQVEVGAAGADDQPGRDAGDEEFERQPRLAREPGVVRLLDLVVIVEEADQRRSRR